MSRALAPPGTKMLSFVPGGGYTRDKKATGSFVSIGATTRDKKLLFLFRLVSTTGIKDLCLPAGPACRWTRDKSHLLSRVQRQPGQMAWNKDLFCSSDPAAWSPSPYLLLVRRRNPKRSGLHACLPRVAFTRCPCLPCVMQRPGLRSSTDRSRAPSPLQLCLEPSIVTPPQQHGRQED